MISPKIIIHKLDSLSAGVKSLFNNKCYRQGGQSSSRFLLVMRELWGSIMTEEQAKICRRMAVHRYLFESVNITLYSFKDSFRACLFIKLPLHRRAWPLFALFLSRVRQVHSFLTRRKSSQAMQPCRQHLFLNKL